MVVIDIPLWIMLIIIFLWLMVLLVALLIWSAALLILATVSALVMAAIVLLVRHALHVRHLAADRAICKWPVSEVLRLTVTFVGFIALFLLAIRPAGLRPYDASFMLILPVASLVVLAPVLASKGKAPRHG